MLEMCKSWFNPTCLNNFGSGKVRFRDNSSNYTHFLDVQTIPAEYGGTSMQSGKFNGTFELIDLQRFYPTPIKPPDSTLDELSIAYFEIHSETKVVPINYDVPMEVKLNNESSEVQN